jgi:hypothetical protein
MAAWIRNLTFLSVVACAPLSRVGVSSSATTIQNTAVSIFQMEVRLRKLHLVRPDLIPYPLEIEVIC